MRKVIDPDEVLALPGHRHNSTTPVATVPSVNDGHTLEGVRAEMGELRDDRASRHGTELAYERPADAWEDPSVTPGPIRPSMRLVGTYSDKDLFGERDTTGVSVRMDEILDGFDDDRKTAL